MVARETGYPTDLLDPDLDLEADLGIDTVKQAEVFAAIREAYGIERDDALKLRDYPTLRHVVRFVIERSPQLVASAAEEEPAPAPELAITERVLEVVARETGYPTDLLDPDLDLEADLGIDTVKQAEVFAAIREAYGIERDDALKLRDYPTLRHVVRFVIERSRQLVASAAEGEPAPAPELAIADRRGPAVAEQPEPEPAIAEQPEPEPALADQPEPEPEDGGRYPRRVPVPVLRPPLDCCVPTGVELAAGQRVVLMPDQGGIATALAGRLRKRGVEVLTIDGQPKPDELETQLAEWAAQGPIAGVYCSHGEPVRLLDPSSEQRQQGQGHHRQHEHAAEPERARSQAVHDGDGPGAGAVPRCDERHRLGPVRRGGLLRSGDLRQPVRGSQQRTAAGEDGHEPPVGGACRGHHRQGQPYADRGEQQRPGGRSGRQGQ